MNLDKKDWAEVAKAFDDLEGIIKGIWIDPDYSSELDRRRFILEVVKNTKNLISGYFTNL